MAPRSFLMPRWGAVFQVLALMALAVNVFVPRGYMLARDDAGGARIAICTGFGPAAAPVPQELTSRFGKDRHDGGDAPVDHAGTVCPYAGHAAPIAAPGAYLLPAPVETFALPPSAGPARGIDPGRGMAAPPPPSQAPPHLSS